MTFRKIALTALALTATGVLVTGCGAEEQAKTEAAPEETTARVAKVSAEYPIDWCVVSGEKLGSMGDPVVQEYQGQTIKFCCDQCVKIFEDNPVAFMAKLDSAATGLLQAPASDEHPGGGHEGHDHGDHKGHDHG